MLAGESVLGRIAYPKISTPKLNGVRGGNQNGQLLARSLKPIPNHHTRNLFCGEELSNLEGELVVGAFNDPSVFTITTSGVMTEEGFPEVVWHLFDYFHDTAPYIERLALRDKAISALPENRSHSIQLIPWRLVHSDAEVEAHAQEVLAQGYEGLVLRDPYAPYKQGRSTEAEGGFLRYCPWFRGEATILDIYEGEVNQNKSVINELGYKKKSSHKANKVGSGRAGVFHVKDLETGIEFNMPVPGFAFQVRVWANKRMFLGKLAHYKFKLPVNPGGKPRFSQFEGLRAKEDMS